MPTPSATATRSSRLPRPHSPISDAEVSMAEISRRAGVGMATLYRNFPGRRELLEALYAERIRALCEATETVDGETPGAVFVGLAAPILRLCHLQASRSPPNCSSAQTATTPYSEKAAPGSWLLAGLCSMPHNALTRSAPTSRWNNSLTWSSPSPDPRRLGYLEPILQAALDGLRPSDSAGARVATARTTCPPRCRRPQLVPPPDSVRVVARGRASAA